MKERGGQGWKIQRLKPCNKENDLKTEQKEAI